MNKKVFLSAPYETYVNAIKKTGLSVTDSPENADGLVLTGGGDISTCAYNEPRIFAEKPDLDRDQNEFFLLKKFLIHKKPILGICRGLQIINVFFDGSLYQNVASHCRVNGKDTFHEIIVEKRSFLDEIFHWDIFVNSAHHQSVKTLGTGLKIGARGRDGIIEAVYGKGIIATQFHPERMGASGLEILRYFSAML